MDCRSNLRQSRQDWSVSAHYHSAAVEVGARAFDRHAVVSLPLCSCRLRNSKAMRAQPLVRIECDAVAVLHAVPDIAEHCTSGPDGFEVNIQDFFARDPAPMQHGPVLASWNLVGGNLHAALLTLCRVDHMKMACKLRLAKHMGKGLDGCHETDLLHLHYYYLLKTLAGRSLIFKTLTK